MEKETEFKDRALERVFVLSTGALALSVTFRSQIIGIEPECLWLLQASWACLTLTCMIHIFTLAIHDSLDAQFLEYEYEVKREKFIYERRRETEAPEELDRMNKNLEACRENILKKMSTMRDQAPVTTYTRAACLLTFIVGIFALSTFAILNT